MYSEFEKKRAAMIISNIAHEHHVPEAQVRAEMQEALESGRRNPDPEVQARWAEFKYEGAEPTIEEFILWMYSTIESGLSDARS